MYFGAFLAFCCLLVGGAASASTSVYGNTNFTGADEVSPNDDSYSPAKRMWSAELGAGIGYSQVVSSSGSSQVRDSQMQFNIGGMVERVLRGPLSAEAGLVLGTQFINYGPQGSTMFSVRYLDLPLLARFYVTRQISIGAGAFAMMPLDSLSQIPDSQKLTTTDLGLSASARYTIPATRATDWIVEAGVERGFVSLGNSGPDSNHIRNFSTLVGMAARF